MSGLPFAPLMEDPRENKGHSLDVLPDLHPIEVNHITDGFHQCDNFDLRRQNALACSVDRMWSARRFIAKPHVVYHDGRAYNHLQHDQYMRDPCKYLRNVYPWEPTPPKIFHPRKGHYNGLSKPPAHTCFKLRYKQVADDAQMPTYELLQPSNMRSYFQHAL